MAWGEFQIDRDTFDYQHIYFFIIRYNIKINFQEQFKMSQHTEFILELRKILNWKDISRYVRIKIIWAADNKLLIQKLVQGTIEMQTLLINLLLKIEMSYIKEKIKIFFFTIKDVLIGELDLYLDQIIAKKQKIQEYPIPKSDKKILQLAKVQVTNDSPKSKRDLRETASKKSIVTSNNEFQRMDDYFIKERQNFLREYRTSMSKQKKKTMPEKIHNLIQDVRNIKEGLRISRTKSNQKLAQSRERIKSIGKSSTTSHNRQSFFKDAKDSQNKKIESSPNVPLMNPNLQQYGFVSSSYMGSQKDVRNLKKQPTRERIIGKNHH